MKVTKTLSRLAAAALIQIKPLSSYQSRKPDFVLVSKLPFNVPNKFNHDSVIEFGDQIVGDAEYLKTFISCADDIVYVARKLKYNIEVIAHGIQISLPEALMEAARTTEAEDCRYIVIMTFKKKPAVILENTTAPESKKTLVIRPLEPRMT